MRLIDADALREKCDAPHWCVWLREIDDFLTADAIPLPKGRPGDYLEWDIGTGATRFYYISAIHITKDSVRYDIGDMCPVVDHRAIVRILTQKEMKKELADGNVEIRGNGFHAYGERKKNAL